MPRRSRDDESESETSATESSGSDEGSYDSYDSESGDDLEAIKDTLKECGAKKYFKVFEKKGIDTIDQAKELTDKKLQKYGVTESKVRKKIIDAFADLETESESETDTEAIKEGLKSAGVKKYSKVLFKAGYDSFSRGEELDDKKLKKLGVKDAKDRKSIIEVYEKEEEGSESESGSESGSGGEEGEVLKRILHKANMKRYYSLFEKKGVTTVKAAKKLEHKDLREMGIHLYRERRDILEEISKYDGEDLPSASSGSEEDSGDNVNMVHEVLRQQYMSRHIPDFDRMGITTLRQARKLTQTQLRSMGVALYLQRERLINAFADYRPKNKTIMKILVDCNLASHAREFEKLIDVEDAKNLTHSDLRAMGINLYGQRERLMRAFMEHKAKK